MLFLILLEFNFITTNSKSSLKIDLIHKTMSDKLNEELMLLRRLSK